LWCLWKSRNDNPFVRKSNKPFQVHAAAKAILQGVRTDDELTPTEVHASITQNKQCTSLQQGSSFFGIGTLQTCRTGILRRCCLVAFARTKFSTSRHWHLHTKHKTGSQYQHFHLDDVPACLICSTSRSIWSSTSCHNCRVVMLSAAHIFYGQQDIIYCGSSQ
jgi:hypothetical protein